MADRSDRNNDRAKGILDGGEPLVTSDHILVESWLMLRHRLGRHAAEQFWVGLRRGVAEVEPVNAADLDAAWQIGQRFADQDFSLVDRTSFAVMHRLGVARAAAFDDDYAIYRFGNNLDRAFEVVR